MNLIDKLKQAVKRIFSRAPPAPVEVDQTKQREQLARYQAEFRTRVGRLAEQLSVGAISVDDWLAGMKLEVRYLHVTAAAIGKGGFGNLQPVDLSTVELRIEDQYRYLTRWAQSLRGAETMSLAALIVRADMYGNAARATMSEMLSRALGMPPLPAHPGEYSECIANCRCHWNIISISVGNWDCIWTLTIAEHCPTCLNRARVWAPLQIRNHKIVRYDPTGLFV